MADVPGSASPALADGLASVETIVQIHTEWEASTLRFMAGQVRVGIDHPDWPRQQAARLAQIRRDLDATVRRLADIAGPQVVDMVAEAYARGHGDPPGEQQRTSLARRVWDALRALWAHLTGSTVREYRRAITAGTHAPQGQRRQAVQRAMDRTADRGLTLGTDTHGRTVGLVPHVQTVLQTAAGNAAMDGYLDALTSEGGDLVRVTRSPHPCPVCEPWEDRILAVRPTTPDRPTIGEARAAGLWHPRCFPGDVLVSAPSGVRAADSRWYEGDVVVVKTASGQELTVTPNHPVLTPEGWVAAGSLIVGDRVFRYGGGDERVNGVSPGDEEIPARIGDVFDALRQASPVGATSVPGSAEQFHGDGRDSDVQVVFADRLLRDGIQGCEMGGDRTLVVGGARFTLLPTGGAADEFGVGLASPARGVVGGLDLRGPSVCAHARPFAGFRLAAGYRGPALDNPPADDGLTGAVSGRDLALRLSGLVTPDPIVDISVREFAAHVYNLQSGDGWYVANGIVVHNCRHTIERYVPGMPRHPHAIVHKTGTYDQEQRQRAIERHIRTWKRREAAALDDVAAALARRKVRQWQAALRAHLAATGLQRSRMRERTDFGHSRPLTHALGG